MFIFHFLQHYYLISLIAGIFAFCYSFRVVSRCFFSIKQKMRKNCLCACRSGTTPSYPCSIGGHFCILSSSIPQALAAHIGCGWQSCFASLQAISYEFQSLQAIYMETHYKSSLFINGFGYIPGRVVLAFSLQDRRSP